MTITEALAKQDAQTIVPSPVKSCGVCHRSYTEEEWARLPFPKGSVDGRIDWGGTLLEARQCPCHNTLCKEV